MTHDDAFTSAGRFTVTWLEAGHSVVNGRNKGESEAPPAEYSTEMGTVHIAALFTWAVTPSSGSRRCCVKLSELDHRPARGPCAAATVVAWARV